MGREFFVPAQTLIVVFLLTKYYEFNVSPEILVLVSDPPVENVP
jgi:hypothetical protein